MSGQKPVLRWDYRRQMWGSDNRDCWGKSNTGPIKFFLGRCVTCEAQGMFYWGKGECRKCFAARKNGLGAMAAKAHAKVNAAIQRGLLPALDGSILCVDCGLPARCYDHRDYGQPLVVAAVCKRCNITRGPAIGVAPFLRRRFKPLALNAPQP